MSGVITAPTMKPPATSVVPATKLSWGPAGAFATSSAIECWLSSTTTAHPTSTRNSGTVTFASHCIEWKPRSTIAVTTSPKTSDHAQAGRIGRIATSPEAETPDWMPNQPMRLSPIARPTSAEPPCRTRSSGR